MLILILPLSFNSSGLTKKSTLLDKQKWKVLIYSSYQDSVTVILQFTWEDHADVSPDDEVEDGVDEHQPAQPTERSCVSSDGRGVWVAPLNA